MAALTYKPDFGFIHSCKNPSAASIDASLPTYPGAVLVAKEHCDGMFWSEDTYYYATGDSPGAVVAAIAKAWGTWNHEEWNPHLTATTVEMEYHHEDVTRKIVLTILGEKLPPPGDDTQRLKVANTPKGTQTFFMVQQDWSMAW